MTQRESTSLTGVNETMLLPLYARAQHTLSARPRFRDPVAVELVDRLDYDFTEARRDRFMSDGAVLRTIVFDSLVGGFLATHDEVTVINIACGLDTRFLRLGNGRTTWYDLDLPPVIDLRRRLLEPRGRHHTIAASALDPAWPRQVAVSGDVLVVVEGLTMYLDRHEVAGLMTLLATHFPGARALIEVMPPMFAKYGRERSVAATGATFTYGCANGEEFCRTAARGWTALHDVPLTEGIVRYHPWTSPVMRMPVVAGLSPRILVLRASGPRPGSR